MKAECKTCLISLVFRLGATRNMVPCLEDVEEGVLKSEVQFLDGTIKVYDGRRVRMMLINVLLVR
jgi:hypothetical protein